MASASDFLGRFRGIAAHRVARALTTLCSGVSWNGVPKGYMAERWAAARDAKDQHDSGLERVSLDDIETAVLELYPDIGAAREEAMGPELREERDEFLAANPDFEYTPGGAVPKKGAFAP